MELTAGQAQRIRAARPGQSAYWKDQALYGNQTVVGYEINQCFKGGYGHELKIVKGGEILQEFSHIDNQALSNM